MKQNQVLVGTLASPTFLLLLFFCYLTCKNTMTSVQPSLGEKERELQHNIVDYGVTDAMASESLTLAFNVIRKKMISM